MRLTNRHILIGAGLLTFTVISGTMTYLTVHPARQVVAGYTPQPVPASPSNSPGILGAATSSPSPVASSSKPAAATAAPAPKPAGPTLVWSDEFNGLAGAGPSTAKWIQDVGGDGWGNDEWEYYTGGTANTAQDGAGNLVITARRPIPSVGCKVGPCDITSGRLVTDGNFAATYGRFEARLKTPAGRGLWPAFWMLSEDDAGEIDVMENNGRDPRVISGSLHVPGHTPPEGITHELSLPAGRSAADTFHIYAVDWTPAAINWSVDGQVYQTVTKSGLGKVPWVFNQPFYILLNLAVGSEDPGYPDATTPFPANLLIDYVRVYQTH